MQPDREIETPAKLRMLICDVDRTLLTHDHRLLPKVVNAAKKLHDVGIPLILASARSPKGLHKVHSEVFASDTVICFNGAWVGNLASLNSLFESQIARELAVEAMELVRANGGHPIWFLRDKCYSCRSDQVFARRRTDVTGDNLEIIDSPDDAPGAPYKVLASIDPDNIVSLVNLLSDNFGDTLKAVSSGPNLVEIVTPKCRKDLAAKVVTDRLGIDRQFVAAAGDSDNDLEILEWAAFSFAPENARAHVRAVANRVVGHCDIGGIAEAFEFLSSS